MTLPLATLVALATALLCTTAVDAGAASLRVMHWNLKGLDRTIGGSLPPEARRAGKDKLPPLNQSEVARIAAYWRPDVIGFDEICRGQLAGVRRRLASQGYRYVLSHSLVRKGACRVGVALLSRHPFLSTRRNGLVRGNLASNPEWNANRPDAVPEYYEIRAGHVGLLVGAVLVVGGKRLSVYEFHSQGDLQVPEAAALVGRDPETTTIAMCDCNKDEHTRLQPGDFVYGPFQHEGFEEIDTQPSWLGARQRPTLGTYSFANGHLVRRYPKWKPDYIFARARTARPVVLGVTTAPSWVSDHFPLIGDLDLL